MARTIKTSASRRRKENFLILPSEEQWEIWKCPLNNNPVFAGNCSDPASANIPTGSALALPVQYVFALPLWIINSDPALTSEVIFLQLDRRGLASRVKEETVMDFDSVAQVDNQNLLLVATLPASLPEIFFSPKIENYYLSAQFYPLPENQFTFWKENGRIVMAVTREKHLIYFQSLSANQFTQSIIQEIRCIHLQLETQTIIHSVVGSTVWGNFSPEEIKPLTQVFGTHITQQQRPAPRLRNDFLKLTPYRAKTAQNQKRQAQQSRKLIGMVAGFYLLVILGLTGYLGWLKYDSWNLQKKLAQITPTVQMVQNTKTRWDALEGAINPNAYPVENLLRLARPLPPDGLRLTLFKQEDPSRFSVQGEVKEDPLVRKYEDELKNQNTDLRWDPLIVNHHPDESNPTLVFSISGARSHASTN